MTRKYAIGLDNSEQSETFVKDFLGPYSSPQTAEDLRGKVGLWIDFDVAAARGAVADDADLGGDARHGVSVADNTYFLSL